MNSVEIFLGTDIVEINRIKASISTTGKRFVDRIFTPDEQNYCFSKNKPEIHFAGRFAAKESVMKALMSSGYKKNISFKSIEIKPRNNGSPKVNLDILMEGKIKISISHTENYAIASAIYLR